MGAEAGRGHLIDLGQLVSLLNDRIDSLVPDLLPLGRRHGTEWVEASTSRGGLGDSLSVKMVGNRVGVWGHFATNRGGDLLDLIAYVRCGDNKADAIRWAKAWLGLGGDGINAAGPDPAVLERARKLREKRAQEAATDRERRSAHARAMWLSAPKVEPDDPVGCYLASRSVGLLQLGRKPGCLRAGQSLRHPSGGDWPAMLAAVLSLEGAIIAVHRTFLTPEGSKAPVDPVKMVLGDFRGGHIPVWKGRHGHTLREIPAGTIVYLTEGIEDGLSVARLLPHARVLAAISTSNMAAIELPPQVREVVIVGQNDPATLPDGRPHPTQAALAAALEAHTRAGRTVRLTRPPEGIKDFNDWLKLAVTKGDRVA